jgi:predicted alpha/beta superfamily hydrolase
MSKKYPRVTIPNTEERTIFSSIVDQEFKIFVAYPRGYSDSDKEYPVLYLLDANAIFGTVAETIRTLQIFQELPEMLLVGIGYPVSNFLETQGFRARDLTPSVDDEWFREWLKGFSEAKKIPLEFKGTGGSKSFFKFIRDELMPFVHSNYRANTEDKAIIGSSIGGLFALYVLFHFPATFNRYIITSPSIWWDDQITLKYEAKFAMTNPELSAQVFMSVGSLEEPEDEPDWPAMVSNMRVLTKTMQDRGYDKLELKAHIFEDETHQSVGPAAISKGLRAVFG